MYSVSSTVNVSPSARPMDWVSSVSQVTSTRSEVTLATVFVSPSCSIRSPSENDSSVENSTFTRDDGTEAVVYRNGTTRPLEEYVDRETETFSEGDRMEHDEETKTVANVTSERVLVTWETEETQSIGIAEGEPFTVGDTEYVATFPDNSTVVISTQLEEYNSYEESVDYYQERTSGLLYVIIFSLGSSFLLAALAFLPHRG